MRFLDLLRMSGGNLRKRKVRTILTVLGVVVGVASIVVMISLGLGLSRSLMAQYESYGSLTQITVNEPWNMDSDAEEAMRLDDALVQRIEGMEHVESVFPVIELSALAKYGSYEGYLQIRGMSPEALRELGMEVGEGKLPGGDKELTFFYGCQVLQNFYNAKGSGGYWETPDIDLMEDPVFIIFDTESYYASQGTTEDGQTVKPPKKYLIPACGVEAMPEDGWSQYGWYTYCDIDQLVVQLQKAFKNKVIPGQPSTKTGKPYKEIFYNTLYVNVDSMDYVMAVQNDLTALGYEAYSNAEWVESEQKTMGYIQAVLGGIGAVSLFVAAIGIANTMMMSIYERTKEIGVMKVLGCDLRDIRSLFLLEAGGIGLIGGVIGLLLSLILSFVINRVAAGADASMAGISYIPFWLALLSLIFAVMVGMLAGFFPARRAMKLSPLAAIRNE
ncbi:MAG: ABC transporter permease [Clostridiales bacterium]|nr:ABC transporter permease [Clostridiales bacterium]